MEKSPNNKSLNSQPLLQNDYENIKNDKQKLIQNNDIKNTFRKNKSIQQNSFNYSENSLENENQRKEDNEIFNKIDQIGQKNIKKYEEVGVLINRISEQGIQKPEYIFQDKGVKRLAKKGVSQNFTNDFIEKIESQEDKEYQRNELDKSITSSQEYFREDTSKDYSQILNQYEKPEDLKKIDKSYPIFKYNQFFEIGFYHFLFYFVTGPFTFLIIWPIQGNLVLCKNMCFLPEKEKLTYFIIQIIQFLSAFMILSLIIFKWAPYCQDEAVSIITFLLMRMLCISIRYGLMEELQYNLLKKIVLPLSQIREDFYLSKWAEQDYDFVFKEIQSAIKRQELDVSYFDIEFMTTLQKNTIIDLNYLQKQLNQHDQILQQMRTCTQKQDGCCETFGINSLTEENRVYNGYTILAYYLGQLGQLYNMLDEYVKHKRRPSNYVVVKELNLLEQQYGIDVSQMKKHLKTNIKFMGNIQKHILSQQEIEPFRIMGIAVTFTKIKATISILIALIGLLIKIYM